MYLVNRSLAIVLLFLFVGKVAVVEAYTELEDGLLENAASEIPYVGPVIGPIVGLLFTPPDEVEALRQEMKAYVDTTQLKQAQGVIHERILGYQHDLENIEYLVQKGLIHGPSNALSSLNNLDGIMVVDEPKFAKDLTASDDDAYLMTYGAFTLLHTKIKTMGLKLQFGDVSWENCRFDGRIKEACAHLSQIEIATHSYWVTLEDAVEASVNRRYASVGETQLEHCGFFIPPSRMGSGGCSSMIPDRFYDARIGQWIYAGERKASFGGGFNWQERRQYVINVENEIQAYWQHTFLDKLIISP